MLKSNELEITGTEWCAGDFFKETSVHCLMQFDRFAFDNINACEGGMKAFKDDLKELFKKYFDESEIEVQDAEDEKQEMEYEKLENEDSSTEENTEVVTVCYGKERKWKNKEEAIAFFREGVLACCGAERDRYVNIIIDLQMGKKIAYDEHRPI